MKNGTGRNHSTVDGPTRAELAFPAASPILLHASMLLSGFGTVFLGPVLPALAAGSHTSDSGSGLFFTAQFVGAFLGGVTTSKHLWRSLLLGSGGAALGFLLLALCVARQASLQWHLVALLPLGFGVGQMLTSTNLLAAHRYILHRGSALALVNFSWSLGAVVAPVLLGYVLVSTRLSHILSSAALLFGLVFTGAALNASFGAQADAMTPQQNSPGATLPWHAFVFFGALLLLYGGVETSLSGWITTFTTRYGTQATRGVAMGTAALWIGITAGRAGAPLLLRRVRESTLLHTTLISASVLTALLSVSRGSPIIVATCLLLGLSLAPWFPLVLSAMLAEGAAAGQVGTIIALSGIGAATIPLLVGVVSRSAGSLRVALAVPLAGLLGLLAMSMVRASRQRRGGSA